MGARGRAAEHPGSGSAERRAFALSLATLLMVFMVAELAVRTAMRRAGWAGA